MNLLNLVLKFVLGPQVATWIDSRSVQSERANLQILFDKYLPTSMEMLKSNRFKKITPLVDGCHVWMLCHLLECLLVPENCPPDCSKELYEQYFVWACIWAMGASLFQDQVNIFFLNSKKINNILIHKIKHSIQLFVLM